MEEGVGEEPLSRPPQAAASSAAQQASRFIYTGFMVPIILLLMTLDQALSPPPKLAVGCVVTGDRDGRVYELRWGASKGSEWVLMMHSKKTGRAPVVLPLPDARPEITATTVTLSYETLNGGRHVEWSVTPSGATLDVHANFELEVNIEADLDPRVEMMNTEGPITRLACEIAPGP
jgi:hypothetical protein